MSKYCLGYTAVLQSWDHPGSTQSLDPLSHSIPEHQSYTSSPGIVQGLPNSLATLCQSIPALCSYAGSPGIVQELPTPVSDYPRTLELHQQSRDYPGTTNSLVPLYHGIPGHHQTPWQSCIRVFQNAKVTLPVPGLSRNYQTPWDPCVRVS